VISPAQVRGTLELGDVQGLLLAGKVLSGIALAAVLAIIVNIWRRPSFPGVSYGSIRLTHGRMRWLWFTLIVGATALASTEDPIARATRNMEDPELLQAAGTTRQTSLTIPFPFYRYEHTRVWAGEELAKEDTLEGFLIPWALLSTIVAYVVLVLRWNPENRWAIRILQGKKHARARRKKTDAADNPS
jgi:hypothetical protein